MGDVRQITAMILAGGLGSRLKPVVSDKPKVMAEVLGKPFLEYLLDQLECAGFKEVILCTGYMAEQIEKYFGAGYKSLNLIYSREFKPLGTGGAVRLALEKVKSDVILVMNGDSYTNLDIVKYINWFFEKDCNASLVLTRVEETCRYGTVFVDKEERILFFEEKSEEPGSGWINAGIYLLRKAVFDNIPKGGFYSLENDLFPKIAGKSLYGFGTDAEFIDVGIPRSYADASDFFAKITNNDIIGQKKGFVFNL